MTNNQEVHVALISNNLLFLAGIRSILNDKPAFTVTMDTNNIADVIESSPSHLDIILISQELLEKSPVKEINNLTQKFQHAKLAMLISDSQNLELETSIQGKVLGYITNDISINLLVTALKTIHQGKYWFSPEIMQLFVVHYKQLLLDLQKQQTTLLVPPPKHLVSRREYDVLQYLAKGYENKDISIALGINESTVKNHIASMFRKNNVNARTPLVLKAIKNNWLSISSEQEEAEKAENK